MAVCLYGCRLCECRLCDCSAQANALLVEHCAESAESVAHEAATENTALEGLSTAEECNCRGVLSRLAIGAADPQATVENR